MYSFNALLLIFIHFLFICLLFSLLFFSFFLGYLSRRFLLVWLALLGVYFWRDFLWGRESILSKKALFSVVKDAGMDEAPNCIILLRLILVLVLLVFSKVIYLLFHDCLLCHHILDFIFPLVFGLIVFFSKWSCKLN